jgi:hypothetical protein
VKIVFVFIGQEEKGGFAPDGSPTVVLSVLSLVITDLSVAPDRSVSRHTMLSDPQRFISTAFATGVSHGGRGVADRVLVRNSCPRCKNYEVHIAEER